MTEITSQPRKCCSDLTCGEVEPRAGTLEAKTILERSSVAIRFRWHLTSLGENFGVITEYFAHRVAS